jgi:hypothetical protein
VGVTNGCHEGDAIGNVGLVIVGELEEIVGSDDGILEGKSVGLTDGVGEETIKGENVELIGTRVKAVGAALGTSEGDNDGLRVNASLSVTDG